MRHHIPVLSVISMTNAFSNTSVKELGLFWWVFALRGGFALLFSGALIMAESLFQPFFHDPILLKQMGLLLGFYVMGIGMILTVAAVVADDNNLDAWWVLLCESGSVILLGLYISITLLFTPRSFALLAGLHALIAGCFQAILALKLRHDRFCLTLLCLSAGISLCAGVAFLAHQNASTRALADWLAGLELFYGGILIVIALRLYGNRSSNINTVAVAGK
jgi:uncharacterized membrane protein HdeD (DUF308 family)